MATPIFFAIVSYPKAETAIVISSLIICRAVLSFLPAFEISPRSLEERYRIFIQRFNGFSIASSEQMIYFDSLKDILKRFQEKDVLDNRDPEIERFKNFLLGEKDTLLKLQSIKEMHDMIMSQTL